MSTQISQLMKPSGISLRSKTFLLLINQLMLEKMSSVTAVKRAGRASKTRGAQLIRVRSERAGGPPSWAALQA